MKRQIEKNRKPVAAEASAKSCTCQSTCCCDCACGCPPGCCQTTKQAHA